MLSERRAYTAPAWGSSQSTWAGGWNVERMRNAIALHDAGRFRESALAAEKVTQSAFVFGALAQRIAPVLRFPRTVEGGADGLDAIVRAEGEALFVGRGKDLAPSFPSLRDTVRTLAMMGFAWWQTAYVLAEDGTERPVTSLWPAESTWRDARGRWFAQTYEDGQLEISPDDPRWTLIGGEQHDNDRCHLAGAIRAIGSKYVNEAFTENDQSEYSDVHGQPKPIGIMPEGMKLGPDKDGKRTEGDDAFASLESLLESRSGALFPHGFVFQMAAAAVGASQVFMNILDRAGTAVAVVLLGTDGTMKAGAGGVYSSPTFNGVAESRTADDVEAISSGASRVLNRWRARNYASARAPLVATIRMPDTQRDARTKSVSERRKALIDNIKAERDAGCEVTQERVDVLAAELELTPPKLAAAAPAGPAQS